MKTMRISQRLSRNTLGFLLAGLLALPAIQADTRTDVREMTGEGYINWTEGMIYATGEAALDLKEKSRAIARVQAERAATVIAQRNLLEIFKGVRVESDTTVENFMLKSDRIKATVTGVVHGSRPVHIEEDPGGGSVKVTIAAPIWGNLARDLLDEIRAREETRSSEIESREKGLLSRLVRGIRRITAWIGGTRAQAAAGKHTGLVVDATETGIKPGLFPRIYDQDGKLVVGPNTIDPEVAIKQGIVGYAPSVEAAENDLKRVGVTPMVSRGAVPVSERSGIDIQVKDLTLAKIKSALEDPNVLKQCRVTVAYKVTF